MKDKADHLPPQIPQDFRNVSRPHSTYASSASSTSSYASSLSSSSSFLHHGKAPSMLEVTPDRISQYSSQYNTLRRAAPPSPSPPSSSPSSSTFESYPPLPTHKYATLSRQDRPHAPAPAPSATLTRVDLNRSRTFLGSDVKGVSSLGEVVALTPGGGRGRSAHYNSTPHLFVFQSVDDSEEEEEEEEELLTKTNTLRNSSQEGTGPLPGNKTSMTLPRLTAPPGREQEPIYSSTSPVITASGRRQEAAAYEVPHALKPSRRSSSCSMIHQDSFAVTNEVVARIETSFKGHKTQMWTCRTMANLYTEEGSGKDATWKLQFTGVPALMLDLGETKSRNKRQLQIILAEKESGFELWKDVIDNLTSYKVSEPHFHTMHLSSDHRRKVGLSFNEGQAAMAFHSQLEALTSDFENISLSAPGKKKKKQKPKEKKMPKYKAPKKTDISTPCNFNHVTTVDVTDKSRLYSLQVYGGRGQSSSPLPAPEPHTVINRPVPSPATAVI